MIMYSMDAKLNARQMVRESFKEILAGTFKVPSMTEMNAILESSLDYSFDGDAAGFKIRRSHPYWDEQQISLELDRQELIYRNRQQGRLRELATETISEIEKLTANFSNMVKEWKINSL
jgi:hypothetical protein